MPRSFSLFNLVKLKLKKNMIASGQGPATFSSCRPKQLGSGASQGRWLLQHIQLLGDHLCTHAGTKPLGTMPTPLPLFAVLCSLGWKQLTAHGELCWKHVSVNCIPAAAPPHSPSPLPHLRLQCRRSWTLPDPSTAFHQLEAAPVLQLCRRKRTTSSTNSFQRPEPRTAPHRLTVPMGGGGQGEAAAGATPAADVLPMPQGQCQTRAGRERRSSSSVGAARRCPVLAHSSSLPGSNLGTGKALQLCGSYPAICC